MLEMLRLEELEGGSMGEVIGKLLARIPGWDSVVPVWERCATVLMILGILLALLQCFGGYKLRRLWTTEVILVFSGFTAGLAAMDCGMPAVAVIGITIVAAVIGALFGWFLWKAGMFLRVLVTVFVVVFAACAVNKLTVIGMIAGLAAGLIMGILVIALHKSMTILYTSLAGGFLAAVLALKIILKWFTMLHVVAFGGGLMVCGILVQWLTNRKRCLEPDTITEQPEAEKEEAAAIETIGEEGQEQLLCPDCKAPYKPNAKFCIMCGKKLI